MLIMPSDYITRSLPKPQIIRRRSTCLGYKRPIEPSICFERGNERYRIRLIGAGLKIMCVFSLLFLVIIKNCNLGSILLI